MFISRASERIFQKNNNFLSETTRPLKHTTYIRGAVIPAIISKFLPVNVIKSGTNFCKESQYNTISTGIRTMLKRVRAFRSSPFIKRLPLFEINNTTITSSPGKTASANLGGRALASLKNPL